MRNGPIGRLRSRKGSRNREEYSRENWVVTQFQFANACGRTFTSSQRRGGRDINKMLRSILVRSGRDGQTGRTKYCAELTTITASRYSARASLPSTRQEFASWL